MPSFSNINFRPAITQTSGNSFGAIRTVDIYITFDRTGSMLGVWEEAINAIKQLIINFQQFILTGDVKVGLTSFAEYNENSGVNAHIVHFDLTDDYDFMINYINDLANNNLANGNTGRSPAYGLAYACSALHPISTSPSTGKGRDDAEKAIILITDGDFILGSQFNSQKTFPYYILRDFRGGVGNFSESEDWSTPTYGGFNFPGGRPNNDPVVIGRIIGVLIGDSNPVNLAAVSGPAGSIDSGQENADWFIGSEWGDFYEIANQITEGFAFDFIPNLAAAAYTSQSIENLNPPYLDLINYSGLGVNDIEYGYHVRQEQYTNYDPPITYLSLYLNPNTSPTGEVRGGSSYTHVKVQGTILPSNSFPPTSPPFNSIHFEHLLFIDPLSADGSIPTTAKWKFKVLNAGVQGNLDPISPILSSGEYIEGTTNDLPHHIKYNSTTGQWDFTLNYILPGGCFVKCTYLLL